VASEASGPGELCGEPPQLVATSKAMDESWNRRRIT
jgi:hypothetical protein